MEKFSNEEIVQMLNECGLGGLVNESDEIDLHAILGFDPEVDEEGQRVLSPYEILRVAPVIDENGNEKPIVFSIRNIAKKIGHFSGEGGSFIYLPKMRKKSDDLISELKKQYRKAMFFGNLEQASSIIDSINELTGGRAEEVLGRFYDYARFYQQMKKQLLINLFAHFFLVFMRKRIIKKGLIKKNKKYRVFREEKFELSGSMLEEIAQESGLADIPLFENIKHIEMEFMPNRKKDPDFDIELVKNTPVDAKLPDEAQNGTVASPEPKKVEATAEPEKKSEFKQFLNKRRIFQFKLFKHLRLKNKEKEKIYEEDEPISEKENILEID